MAILSREQAARVVLEMERFELARPLYSKIVQVKQTTLGHNHPEVAKSLLSPAQVLTALGDHGKPIQQCELALSIFRVYFDPDDDPIVDTLEQIARTFHGDGRSKKALILFKEALKLTKRRHGIEHERFATTCKAIASVQLDLGLLPEAREAMEIALSVYRAIYPSKHSKIQSMQRQVQRLENCTKAGSDGSSTMDTTIHTEKGGELRPHFINTRALEKK